jgi:predicted flap endonuclease-1-like 5' DNA nuclease
MKYIDKWLSGLGLEYIIPKLEENGITTPKKLAQLTLRDMFEVGKGTQAESSLLNKGHPC